MKVGVLGAGAVGAYVGCLVQQRSEDCDVVLVGRERLEAQVRRGGAVLDTVGNAHGRVKLRKEEVVVTQDVAKLRGCDVVLVACKATGTTLAARQLAQLARTGGLPPGALVLSLQNGVSNGNLLCEELDGFGVAVLPCMVNFNVVWSSYGDPGATALHIRRCTPPKIGLPCIRIQNLPKDDADGGGGSRSRKRRRKTGGKVGEREKMTQGKVGDGKGKLPLTEDNLNAHDDEEEKDEEREEEEEEEEEDEEEGGDRAAVAAARRVNLERVVRALKAGGALRVSLTDNIRDVLYSKLLINLQSAVNALSRVPVPVMLSRRGYRMAWRGMILEALEVYRVAVGRLGLLQMFLFQTTGDTRHPSCAFNQHGFLRPLSPTST